VLANKLLGVIFDLDNTLVSSSLNFDSIRAVLGCSNDIDLLSFVEGVPQQQKIEANELLVEYETNDALGPEKLAGSDELLGLLSTLAIPFDIVTRNAHEVALLKIKNNNIDIHILLTREDHKAKPATDDLLHLAEYWNIPPENLLYVGDYLYDLQAEKNANTMSWLITYGKTVSYSTLANILVNDFTELCDGIKQMFSVEITDVH
jgi:phosphoglycolate phosphatase-like HAD superfamily hydrolase